MAYIRITAAKVTLTGPWQDCGFKGHSDRKKFVATYYGAKAALVMQHDNSKTMDLEFAKGAKVLVGDNSFSYVEEEQMQEEDVAIQKLAEQIRALQQKKHDRPVWAKGASQPAGGIR